MQSDATVQSSGQIAPAAIDVEKAIIGAVLADAETVLPGLIGEVKGEHFSIKTMRTLWETIEEMYRDQRTIDLVTVVEHLGPGKLLKLGGQETLIGAFDMINTTETITAYVDILKSKWRTKEFAKSLKETQSILEKEGFDVAYDKAQDALIGLSQLGRKAGFVSLQELAIDWFNDIEAIRTNPQLLEKSYLPTGFRDYDEQFTGLPNGMTILAGRPAMGKTGLAVNIALNTAMAGKSVLFFSLEMSKSQLVSRILSSLTRIDSTRLERGQIHEKEIPTAIEAVGVVSSLDFQIDEEAIDLTRIRAQIEQWRLQNGRSPDLVVIDYLGLVKVPGLKGEKAEYLSVGRVCQELSVYFAKQLQSPLLMLAQLNRGVEGRTDKRPKLSDLRDSGEIEQAAGRVDMIYRDEYYNPHTPDQGIAEILTTKNRFGPTGVTRLHFEAETTTFHNIG